MTDAQQTQNPTDTSAAAPAYTQRIVKINGVQVNIDASILNLPLDQLQKKLRATGYPEVANAQQRVDVRNGIQYVEYLPVPGRKG